MISRFRVFISILPPPRFPLSAFFHRVCRGCINEGFEDVVVDSLMLEGAIVEGSEGSVEGSEGSGVSILSIMAAVSGHEVGNDVVDVEIVDVGSVDVGVSTRGRKMLEDAVVVVEDFDASIVFFWRCGKRPLSGSCAHPKDRRG